MASTATLEHLANREYKYGFVTDIETETIGKGLTEETIHTISEKKNEPEWMLEFRLKAFRHWLKMTEPNYWANFVYPTIDFQNITGQEVAPFIQFLKINDMLFQFGMRFSQRTSHKYFHQ